MAAPATDGARASSTPVLSPEERRWLHDKFERLASEEAQLAASRTSYYAAIGTVLITGLIVVAADLAGNPLEMTGGVTFLASLGVLISLVWAVLLHRTNDAQKMWREAALQLETVAPPLAGQVLIGIELRSGDRLPVDLLRPYTAHHARFSASKRISWMDRVNPERLTEVLPMTFLGVWSGALVLIWVWFFFLR
ncbi:MAG: hypothetical protein L3K01_03935 [Thermoplasmata archaeon]|nr:hypothetical protein [Thermoplasmata archaeon]